MAIIVISTTSMILMLFLKLVTGSLLRKRPPLTYTSSLHTCVGLDHMYHIITVTAFTRVHTVYFAGSLTDWSQINPMFNYDYFAFWLNGAIRYR